MSAEPVPETVRVVVVDDEAPARQILCEYLGAHPGVEVVARCANGFEAVKAVAELEPDLVFLDIRMPKLDGFEVVELLGPSRPAIVFVTAYDEYAIKAFEVHALDYLLKPVSRDRLAEALERVRDRRRPSAAPEMPADLAREARPDRGFRDRVLVRDGAQIHVVPAARIDYVEAQDDYVVIVSGEHKLRKQETLGQIEATLDPGRFVRVHRSYLLNVDRLARLELYAKDSRVAILRDGSRLSVSRSGYARLRELL